MTAKLLQKELMIPSDPKHLRDARGMVREACETAGIKGRDGRLMVLAVDEAVTSIVTHAKDTNRQGDVRVLVDINETRFRAFIEDFTNHTDSSALSEVELVACLDQERKHQLGVFLMREIMDEVTYTYKRGFQNDLELIKFL